MQHQWQHNGDFRFSQCLGCKLVITDFQKMTGAEPELATRCEAPCPSPYTPDRRIPSYYDLWDENADLHAENEDLRADVARLCAALHLEASASRTEVRPDELPTSSPLH